MATYVLIHGAGDVGWYWHLLEADLRERGHDVVAPNLPCEDDSAGLPEYADAVIEAIGSRTDLIVVAQSFGGFTAPLICTRLAVDLLVLVAPMIPAPGEAPADYWMHTRYDEELHERYDGLPSSTRTFHPSWRPRRCSTAGRNPRLGCTSPHRSRRGPTYQRGSYCVETTACSRHPFCAG
jgi:pimeloyl-ACP methyl ester carboxylesterase